MSFLIDKQVIFYNNIIKKHFSLYFSFFQYFCGKKIILPELVGFWTITIAAIHHSLRMLTKLELAFESTINHRVDIEMDLQVFEYRLC